MPRAGRARRRGLKLPALVRESAHSLAVVQWIERPPPKRQIQVRFLSAGPWARPSARRSARRLRVRPATGAGRTIQRKRSATTIDVVAIVTLIVIAAILPVRTVRQRCRSGHARLRRRHAERQAVGIQARLLRIGVFAQEQALPHHAVERAAHLELVLRERAGSAPRPTAADRRWPCVGLGLRERDDLARPSQPSFACAPGAQRPAGVGRSGTVTSGRRTPAMSLPSASVFGT